MAQTNEQILEDKLAGTIGLDNGGRATIRKMFDTFHVERIAADGAANTTIAATKFFSNPFDFSLLATFYLNEDSAVTADATNFGGLAITIDDGANGSPVAAASWSTATVNHAADTDVSPGTVNTANCVIAAGANVFYAQTKNGAGVQFPARMLKARFQRL